MEIKIKYKPILKTFIIALLIIILLNLLAIVFYFQGVLQEGIGSHIWKNLYVDHESNLPSFFNTILILVNSVLLFFIHFGNKQIGDNSNRYWLLLSIVFLFLAFDENTSLHEFLIILLPKYGVGGTGYFRFAWVIPYGLLTLIFSAVLYRFIFSLDSQTRNGFILSGIVFISGAIGIEMISSKLGPIFQARSVEFALIVTVEESMEMIGMLLFMNYLLKFIHANFKESSVHFAS